MTDKVIGTTLVQQRDGKRPKTALVADEHASFSVIRPDGSFICEVNLFTYDNGRIILDVIDLNDQFRTKTVFAFHSGTREFFTPHPETVTISVDMKL